MSDERRSSRCKCSVPQRSNPIRLHPCLQDGPSLLTLRLQRRLQRVDGRENHAERRSGEGGEYGLEEGGHTLHVGVALEECEDTSVGCSVAEARDGALNERGREALIVPRPAAVVVEDAGGLGRGGAVSVLVVHHGANGLVEAASGCGWMAYGARTHHERQHLEEHGWTAS